MMRFLFGDMIYKLLSLAMAVLLWMLIVGDPEVSASVRVPVVLRNLPRQLEIASELPDRVLVEAVGPKGRVTGGSLENRALVLDMAKFQHPGEFTFTFGPDDIDLPSGVRFERAIPAQVRIALEPRLSRDLPVRVRFATPPAEGYRIASQQVQPPTIRILGPAARVRRTEAAETDPLNLSGVIGEREYQTQVYVNDPFVRLETSPQVTVRVVVERSTGTADQHKETK